MAGASLLTLLDDIATLLDDIALMSKMAVKKTAGVLGDDLALNAQQVTGVQASRELSVVWAVCKGSLLNKVILVPAALAISAFVPWLITPLLMVGGAFLCFEGFEKVAERYLHPPPKDAARLAEERRALAAQSRDVAGFERSKIKGAIRTDFILSAEIIAITLGVVQAEPLLTRSVVLAGVAIALTLCVYGLVAAIVRIDDLGLYLTRKSSDWVKALGQAIVQAAPWLMKGLSFFGTIAMFLVGGGILVHGVPPLAHRLETLLGGGALAMAAINGVVGLAVGAVLVGTMLLIRRLRS